MSSSFHVTGGAWWVHWTPEVLAGTDEIVEAIEAELDGDDLVPFSPTGPFVDPVLDEPLAVLGVLARVAPGPYHLVYEGIELPEPPEGALA